MPPRTGGFFVVFALEEIAMETQAYLFDLSEYQWQLIASCIPPARFGGRPRSADTRAVVSAIFYKEMTGCPWRQLPADLPPWPTVYAYFRQWQDSGVWRRICSVLDTRFVRESSAA
jgi:transposase